MNATEQELDINFEVLRAVDNAVPHKVRLDTEVSERKSGLLQQYIMLKMHGNYQMLSIKMKKAMDRSDEEKALLKEWTKRAKKEFNALKAFLYPANPMSRPMESLAQKISLVVQMLRYIGVKDFDDALSVRGIQVSAQPIEEMDQYWGKEDTKNLAKDIFDQVKELCIDEMNENAAIKEVEYLNMPSQVVYSADNKGGITVSQFTKLVRAKAVAVERGDERYTAYKNRLVKKDEGALQSAEKTLEITKEM